MATAAVHAGYHDLCQLCHTRPLFDTNFQAARRFKYFETYVHGHLKLDNTSSIRRACNSPMYDCAAMSRCAVCSHRTVSFQLHYRITMSGIPEDERKECGSPELAVDLHKAGSICGTRVGMSCSFLLSRSCRGVVSSPVAVGTTLDFEW